MGLAQSQASNGCLIDRFIDWHVDGSTHSSSEDRSDLGETGSPGAGGRAPGQEAGLDGQQLRLLSRAHLQRSNELRDHRLAQGAVTAYTTHDTQYTSHDTKTVI